MFEQLSVIDRNHKCDPLSRRHIALAVQTPEVTFYFLDSSVPISFHNSIDNDCSASRIAAYERGRATSPLRRVETKWIKLWSNSRNAAGIRSRGMMRFTTDSSKYNRIAGRPAGLGHV